VSGPGWRIRRSELEWYVLNVWENPFYADTLGELVISIGNDKDYLASYLSYKLDLRGPAVNIQSTCSTSLLTVHLACQSLLAGECHMALAGGVSVRVQQQSGYLYYEGGTGSPDGRTRAFDADADGTVGGSGVGLVVLKRLEDALRDRDYIHAVILGSAANNDGALKVGYTAPSVAGQSEVIRQALALADVDAETVTYVEAHGTGTALGDPVEVKALTNAFRSSTHKTGYCAIGSVKSNIGHLDSAAGVAGLIKAVLSIREGKLVPTLHYCRPNPHIDFDNSPFYVNADLRDWQPRIGPRRAGVSSFGLGGTNVHLILEQPPAQTGRKSPEPPFLITASAKTRKSLTTGMQRLADYLMHNRNTNMADFTYTLQTGRRAFNHRWSSVCSTREEAVEKFLDGISHAKASVETTATPRLCFLFPGLGCQQPGMATRLYHSEPAFRNAIDECCAILEPLLSLDLRQLLVIDDDAATGRSSELIHEGWIGQPAVFTFEYALATLLMSWRLQPSAMLGHSLGEYVAACLAGVLSLPDALMLVAKRARMMDMTLPGGMLSIPLGEEEVRSLLIGEVVIALVNSRENCVVAGSVPAIEELEAGLLAQGVTARRIRVGHAYHSPAMDPVLEPFARIVSQIQLHTPRIPYLSNVTGTWIEDGQACAPQYWAEHLRETVRFADCLDHLFSAEHNVVLEIAPSPVLTTLVKQACGQENTIVLSSLPSVHDPTPQRQHLLQVIGQLWETGVEVAWPRMYEGSEPGRIPLPTYAWDQQRYWVAGKAESSHFNPQSTQQAEPLSEQMGQPDPELGAQEEYEPETGSQIERTIAALWKNMLGVSRVRVDDSFFALGGDSLLALQLTAKLNKIFSLNLSLHTVLEAKTLARLAAKVKAESGQSTQSAGSHGVSDPLIVEIEPGKAEPPVFLLHAVGGSVFSYAPLCEKLRDGYRLIGVQPEGFDGTTPLLTTVEEMARRYVLAIKRPAVRSIFSCRSILRRHTCL
jgi:acyl transferase domain-containing protein